MKYPETQEKHNLDVRKSAQFDFKLLRLVWLTDEVDITLDETFKIEVDKLGAVASEANEITKSSALQSSKFSH